MWLPATVYTPFLSGVDIVPADDEPLPQLIVAVKSDGVPFLAPGAVNVATVILLRACPWMPLIIIPPEGATAESTSSAIFAVVETMIAFVWLLMVTMTGNASTASCSTSPSSA